VRSETVVLLSYSVNSVVVAHKVAAGNVQDTEFEITQEAERVTAKAVAVVES
jgi:hypothetical protein